jgi:hypothetical protein
MRPSAVIAPFLLLSALLPACSGEQKSADPNWSSEPVEKQRALRETEALNQAPTATPAMQTALLGVRHDLMLADGAHTARCNCLAVEVGPAADARFFWTGGAPDTGDNALAVAIGARGVPCVGGDPEEKRRPSISAVDQVNDDVILEIEDLPDGRPLASGAIIPRPGAKGGVFVRPRDTKVIYAKGAVGGRCKVQ